MFISASTLHSAFLPTHECVSDLLQEFLDVLQSDELTAAAPPCHKICHHILTKPGQPVLAKSCHLDPAKLAVAKTEFSAMEKAGDFPMFYFSLGLFFVHGQEEGWECQRLCGNYCQLITATNS